jgi:diguanylate cyclase (GGDEF)-like protein
MRLITRADTSLVGGLIASALILFHQPMRSALDAVRAIEGEYHLDLMPSLIVLVAVFMYHQHQKHHQSLADMTTAAEEARHHRLRAEELEAILSFGQMLASALDLHGLRHAVIRSLPSFAGERPMWVLIRRRSEWEALAVDPITEQEVSLEDLQQVALTALLSSGAQQTLHSEGVTIDSTFCLPLVVNSTPIGVLGVRQGAHPLDVRSRRALGVAASVLSIAVRNVQLLIETKEFGVHDSLTGCVNRKSGLELLDTELRRARRVSRPLSVLMLDVDAFKQINDRYGHLSGDLVLSTIGRHLMQTLRSSDHKCRYGGDEFILILPDTPPQGAEYLADTLCKAIMTQTIQDNGQQLSVTVSIGIVSVMRGELDLKAVISRADTALYRAKNAGRNRWCRASTPAAGPDARDDSDAEVLTATTASGDGSQ